MGTHKKTWMIGGLILLILYLGNIWYYLEGSIQEPLFIKQYTEAELYPNNNSESVEIPYIIAKGQGLVRDVSFPELSDETFYLHQELMGREGRYELYALLIRERDLLHNVPHLEAWSKDPTSSPIKLTKMLVYAEDGTSREVDLGAIYLYPFQGEREEATLYKEKGISGSSNDTRIIEKTEHMMLVDGYLHEPTGPFMEKLTALFDISINDTPLEAITFPLALEAGKRITIHYESKDERLFTKTYRTGLNFEVEDEAGNKEMLRSEIFQSMHQLRFGEREVIKSLQGEVDSYE